MLCFVTITEKLNAMLKVLFLVALSFYTISFNFRYRKGLSQTCILQSALQQSYNCADQQGQARVASSRLSSYLYSSPAFWPNTAIGCKRAFFYWWIFILEYIGIIHVDKMSFAHFYLFFCVWCWTKMWP